MEWKTWNCGCAGRQIFVFAAKSENLNTDDRRFRKKNITLLLIIVEEHAGFYWKMRFSCAYRLEEELIFAEEWKKSCWKPKTVWCVSLYNEDNTKLVFCFIGNSGTRWSLWTDQLVWCYSDWFQIFLAPIVRCYETIWIYWTSLQQIWLEIVPKTG